MVISLVRDAALCFVYENTIMRLYALNHKIHFFSLLDDERPDEKTDVIIIPGGYPELYANKLSSATRFSVFLRKYSKVIIYAECGGYITLSQLLIKGNCSWLMLGALKTINRVNVLKLELYKYCVLLGGKRGVFAGHEFRYYTELSEAREKTHVYLIKAYDELKLGGVSADNVVAGYTHCIDSIK